jgi:hypothetical protein
MNLAAQWRSIYGQELTADKASAEKTFFIFVVFH